MRQVFQSLDSGETRVLDVPAPSPGPGEVLIATRRSVVSAGTERMLVDFGKAGLIGKARQQPERVREVIDKATTDGLAATISAVRSKLAQPLPLGYSNAGVVLDVGTGVDSLAPGDRVVSNSPHAEVVCVPANLCARIPDGPVEVSDEAAVFTVLGAIGLQGIRLAEPTLGERFVVTGLGLIGQLTVQLLHAHGCAVLGIDPDPERAELARRFGAEAVVPDEDDPERVAERFSRGRGVDGVLVTAATSSSEPLQQAARMCRKRGRIVLVGVTGLELSRQEFFEKELAFHVSCSYGPGRYDPSFEQQGLDYPVGFVRWTQTRNFEAILDLLATGKLDPAPLISAHVDIGRAPEAYEHDGALGTVLTYPEQPETPLASPRAVDRVVEYEDNAARVDSAAPVVAVIGAGSYAVQTLIPAFATTEARLRTVVSRGGASAAAAADRFAFERATTDVDEVFADDSVTAVVVATRHDSHAELAARALEAGKHVYVEKPLAITEEGLERVRKAYDNAGDGRQGPILMVGFNRRFAPLVVRMRELLRGVTEPKALIMTVNAGTVPPDHWTIDPKVGGGRIIGEGCHFVDLLRHLAAEPITDLVATPLGSSDGDSATISLTFAEGSTGTVHYLANGHGRFPKERLEVFSGGRILTLENFRRLKSYGWARGPRSTHVGRQDKGHGRAVSAFLVSAARGEPPIPSDEVFEVAAATLRVANDLSPRES